MPQHWVLIRISPHGGHPVSHKDQVTLRAYFDEAPQDRSDQLRGGSDFAVPVEHGMALNGTGAQVVYHTITKAEYDAGTYDYFLWAEPYGSAALRCTGVHEDRAVGRLQLGTGQQKSKGPASAVPGRPAAMAADDLVIVFAVELANSLAQYMADEMNRNRASNYVYRNRNADGGAGQLVTDAIGLVDTFRQFHTDDGWQQSLWDTVFVGGGDWDHKPRIQPVWGARNRLGNSGDIFYYDYWSNIHFGFILAQAGYSQFTALFGANVAQLFDRFGNEDQFDKEPTRAGWRLSELHGHSPKSPPVTRQELLDIFARHPHWEAATRTRMTRRPPSTFQQIRDGVNKFERASPMEQIQQMQRLFGG